MWKRILLAASALAVAVLPAAVRSDQRPVTQVRWRNIGPALPEGRASSVVGSEHDPLLYYAGTADGGVWKSGDGGVSWHNLTDSIHLASVGALALDPSDDNTLWVGAGETNPRNDIIQERGLYRTTNGGRTWQTVTFPGGPGTSKIVLDPKDPKHVVIGVLGDVFAPSVDRGVYVTFDGGATWSKSLFVSQQSGASDLAMDPHDPNVIFAGMWHVLRRPWAMTSGGTDDGLYRSADGGKTWTQVSGSGFPQPPIGRIGLAIAPTDSKRIYALVETANGVLWRSDDGGVNWKMMSKDSLANQRPFYFSHVRVAPGDANTVYGVSMLLTASYNGGAKFNIANYSVHSDLHELWIASNGKRMALAGDGGVAISADGGSSWNNSRNIPIAQVYRVATSDGTPYIVCGGLQDNNAYCGTAFSGNTDGLTNRDWFKVVEGDGEWAVPDPTNPRLVWADSENGEIQIYDRLSHDSPNVRPYRGTAAEDFVLANARYRFNWQSPIAFAAYDPHLAFLGGNVVFATADRGKTWKIISPDLTRNDKSKQQVSKDSVTHDESGAENYGTLLDIETSALHKGEIWTGSDDGLVHLTLDGGKHWRDVTPAGLAPDSAIETIAPSTLADGTAYVSADRHAMGDDAAYIYVTHDFGTHWIAIGAGLPAGEFARAVRPDIHNRNIVYAGTNRGIRISCDSGTTWQAFQGNLPAVEVRDIRFQPRYDDLVIATHGRAIWVLDDARVVQSAGCAQPSAPLVIGPRPAIELNTYRDDEGNYQDFVAGQPGGSLFSGGGIGTARIYYWLPTEAKVRPTIDVYDVKGHRVRQIAGEHDTYAENEASSWWLTKTDGKNEFYYDFAIDGPARYTSAPFFFRGPLEGPQLPPGHYALALHLEDKTYRFPLVLMADPLATTTQAEYIAAFTQQRRIFDLLDRTDIMLNELARVRDAASNAKLQKQVDEIDALVATLTSSPQSFEDFIQKPGKLREDVLSLANDEPLAQASLQLYARLESMYAERAQAYNAWVASYGTIDAAIKAAGGKSVAAPKPARTTPNTLSPIVTH